MNISHVAFKQYAHASERVHQDFSLRHPIEVTGTNHLETNCPILETLLKTNVTDHTQFLFPKTASTKVSKPNLIKRSIVASRGDFTPPRTYQEELCVSAESKILTDDEILKHIDEKVASFLFSMTHDGGNCSNGKPLVEEANSLPLVHGRHGLEEPCNFSNDKGMDIVRTTYSGEGNNWTSGSLGGYTQPNSVEWSLSQDCDLQLNLSSFPSNGLVKCVDSDDYCGYNVSLRKPDKGDYSMCPKTFHMEDVIHYPLNTLKELIASLENAETKAAINNFTKVLVNNFWNGDVDNVRIFASTEYPQIMLDVAATCTKHEEDESPMVLTTCSGLNMERLTEAHLSLLKNWAPQTPLKSAPLNNAKHLPGKDIEASPQVTTAKKGPVGTENINSVAADDPKDKCSHKFKSTTTRTQEKVDYEAAPVGETKQVLKNPIYEDISEEEYSQKKLSPLCMKVIYDDVSDADSQTGIMKDVPSPSHEHNHQRPLCADVRSEVHAEAKGKRQPCETEEEWIVIPLSLGSVDFLPEIKTNDGQRAPCSRGDGFEIPNRQDNPVESATPCAPSLSSSLQVFDTFDSFEKAHMGNVGFLQVCEATALSEEKSNSRPNSESEDSCETEYSCDYSTECADQNRLTVSKKFLEKMRTTSVEKRRLSENSSDDDDGGPLSSRSKRGQCFKKLKRLMNHSRKPNEKPNKKVIVIDSDSEDESDELCQMNMKRKRRKSSSLSVGEKEDPIIIEIASSTDEEQHEDVESNSLNSLQLGNNSDKHRLSSEASNTPGTCSKKRLIESTQPITDSSSGRQSNCKGFTLNHSLSQKGKLAEAKQGTSKSTARKSTGAHTPKRARRTDSTNSEDDLKTQRNSLKIRNAPQRRVHPKIRTQMQVERNANPRLNSVIPCLYYQICPPSGHLILTTSRVLRKKVSPLISESSSDELEERENGCAEPKPVIEGQCKEKCVSLTKSCTISNMCPPYQDVSPVINSRKKDCTNSGREVSGSSTTSSITSDKSKNISKLQRSMSSHVSYRRPPLSSSSNPEQLPANIRIRDDWKSQHIETYQERRHSQAAAVSETVQKHCKKPRESKKRAHRTKNVPPLMKKTQKMCKQEKKRYLAIESSFPVGDGFKWRGKPSGSTKDSPWSEYGSPPRIYE